MTANVQLFYDRVEDDALQLPEEVRVCLIEKLQASLKAEPSLSEEWIAEIDKRADDIDSGRVQLIDGEDFMRRFNTLQTNAKL
jgi:putative addiction module component (TIGR02574 family)